MAKRAPQMSDLRYLGTVEGPRRGSNGLGDPLFGSGLSLRRMDDGSLRLYFASYNPVDLVQATIPGSCTGKLEGIKKIGQLPCHWSKPWGLYYDPPDNALFLTCHNDYDGDVATAPTVSRGYLDDASGTLTTDKQWAFDRSDKYTDGGICALPDGRLACGFGGYRSVVATGPASMGAALAAFDRPVRGYTGTIPTSALLQYPYSTNFVPRMNRPPNYQNDIAGDNPGYKNPPPGWTTWADWNQQTGVWIETTNLSGLLMVWMRATGRVWYTNQVEADGWQFDLVCYSRVILDNEGQPAPEGNYQPVVDEPFMAPGFPVSIGWGSVPPRVVTGVAYEPESRTLVVGLTKTFGTDAATWATGYFLFEVVDDEIPPEPEPPEPDQQATYEVLKVSSQRQRVQATSIGSAIDAAETSGQWSDTGRRTYDVEKLEEQGE